MSWQLDRDGHVVVVRMAGTKANVQNDTFFDDLHAAFDRLEDEFAGCAVVLTGEGSFFSAGLDVETVFPLLASTDLERLAAWTRRYEATNLRVWRFPRPTVAAVNGAAFAGGMITALDCDQRVAAEGARLSLTEVRIGLPMPPVYVEIIRHAAGPAAAAAAILSGRVYGADEACRMGFVHAVTGADGLLGEAMDRARAIPPEGYAAYAFSKRALQAPALERIQGAAARLGEELPGLFSSDAGVRLRAGLYASLRGHPPPWERGGG